MDQDKMDKIIAELRGCLVSVQGAVPLRQLENDFYSFTGIRIPYGAFGFPNLIAFLRAAPSLIVTQCHDGTVMVDARPTQQSSHISSMVSRQKAAPKKRQGPNRLLRYNNQHRENPWRVKAQVNLTPKRQFQTPPRLTAISHNQFLSRPPTDNSRFINNKNNSSSNSNNRQPVTVNHNNNNVKKAPQVARSVPAVPSKVVVPEKNVTNVTNGVQAKEQSPPIVQQVSRPPTPKSSNSVEEHGPSSPLVNAKKRLSKLMADMDLERDSGNSSPTCELGTSFRAPISDFVPTGDSVADLKAFVELHKMGEIQVKFSESVLLKKQSKIVHYHCKIQIGEHSYTSYPNEFRDRVSAEKYTSQMALDDLIVKQTRRRSLLISSPEDVFGRIPPMLEKYMGAVWKWQIELDYIDMYGEQLPTDWLQIVDNSPHVNLEKQPGGHILRYCESGETFQDAGLIGASVKLDESEVSVPCNTVRCDGDSIEALVTSPMSPGEIWCQQTGTRDHDAFVKLSAAMNAYYERNADGMAVKEVNVRGCYAIRHEENWVRVRALQAPEGGKVGCFLIDYGDDCEVPVASILKLKREFATTQAQAFVCRLVGLEDFYGVSSESLQLLKGKDVSLKIVENEIADLQQLTLPVIMYEKNETVSLNDELVTSLTIDAAAPILNKESVTEVYVTNVYRDGEVYVQVRTPGHADLAEMLGRLGDEVDRHPREDLLAQPVTRDSCQDRLYLVRSSETQKWARAAVVDWAPRLNFAQFEFVDTGVTEVFRVGRDPIYPLDLLDDVINQYPPQAVKARLAMDAIPGNFEEMAKKLMPPEEKMLLKVVGSDGEGVPLVEIFKRTADGLTVCVNKAITLDTELSASTSSQPDDHSNKRLLNLVKLNEGSMKKVPSGGSLPSPHIPKKGQYFEVNISFAVNPWNFFVQPLSTEDKLKEMMGSMQQRYGDQHFSPLPIEDIQPGNIYASKYETGFWYRTSVLKVIHPGSISVFYCDYGYYANLSVHQLVPLDSCYKELPYQALKAKLAGIKPIKNKWTVDDCETFKNFVTKRCFVSLIEYVGKDELYLSDFVIELHLIDTSTEVDVHVRDELIKKGIAIEE